MLDLALSPWLPVRRRDGTRERLAPWQITDQIDTNPVIAIDATRAPWNAALTEFLVALFQTVLFPEDGREWRSYWDTPPTPEELKGAFGQVAGLFDLEGERPFMQDRTLKADGRDDDYRKPIQKFLVDGVSEQQEKNNSDLFEKSGAISALCAPCAATALFDMQAHAPQGSAGYYTSLRGGGPSTTLVLGETLWETVWANVLEQPVFDMKGRPDPATFLPWTAPASRTLSPNDTCSLHVYWGMPRRVLLEKSDPGPCDTCGSAEGVYRSFLSYRGGFHYSETQWRHPLSPYVRSKDDAWLVRATEPDLAGYRHYMGLLVDTPQGDGVPAMVVRRAVERGLSLRVWGYGYQCDQALVVSWCEGVMPVETAGVKEQSPLARTMVALSQRGVERLSDAFHGVWDQSQAGGAERAKETSKDLWALTECAFMGMLQRSLKERDHGPLLDEWVALVQRAALFLYRRALPRTRIDAMWAARFEHRLAGQLSDRNPVTLKTRKYGDWRIHEAV